MKCFKCGAHMTKSGGFATCDDCGRFVSYTPRKKKKSTSSSSDIGLGRALLGLGALGVMAVFKNDYYYHEHHSFGRRILNFFRNLSYTFIALLYIALACVLFYFIDDLQVYSFFSWIGVILASLILIWCAILTMYLKGYHRLSAKNIIGSVLVNAIFKVGGVIILFIGIFPFWISLLFGIFFFVAGHYVYKEIRDS